MTTTRPGRAAAAADAPGAPTTVLAQAWAALRRAEALTGVPHTPPAGTERCEAALTAVHRALVTRLVDAGSRPTTASASPRRSSGSTGRASRSGRSAPRATATCTRASPT